MGKPTSGGMFFSFCFRFLTKFKCFFYQIDCSLGAGNVLTRHGGSAFSCVLRSARACEAKWGTSRVGEAENQCQEWELKRIEKATCLI